MDNEFNKDLTPEEETVSAEETVEEKAEEQVAETAQESAENKETVNEAEEPKAAPSAVEEEISARIEKRFSKYPQPSALEEFAVTKAQKAALAQYTEAYESYAQAENSKEKRKVILNLNSRYYAPELSCVMVAFEASKSDEAAVNAVAQAKKLKKRGKLVSGIFLGVFFIIAAVFTVIKVIPNISGIGDITANGFYFVCLAAYIILSVYAAAEIKNLFASMANTKAQKLLPTLENVPQKLEGAELSDYSEPCIRCGENPAINGSEYCEKCHTELLSTKIPFLGWISGAGILVATVASLVVLFFTAAPAFYGLSAEIAAKDNRWDDANEHYSELNATVNEFSSYLDPDSFVGDILKVNKDIQIKQFIAYAKSYGAIQAVQSINNIVSDPSIIETEKELYPYIEIYTRYYNTANICSTFLEGADEEDYDLYVDALTKALNEEGVDKAIIYYSLFGLSSNEDKDLSVQLDYLNKTEQAAKENGYDYLWLYAYEYASTLKKAGEYEKAVEYYTALTENNKNDLYSYMGMAKCLVSMGKTEQAEAILKEIRDEQGESEFTYAIEAMILRTKGEYDSVIELCSTVIEDYQTSPEIHHQLSLTYLLKGDYDKAYEHADNADYNGVYWAQYGLQKAYSFEYLNNLFLTANLCIKNKTELAQTAQNVITELESYGEKAPEIVSKIVNGEVALEDIIAKGAYDIL